MRIEARPYDHPDSLRLIAEVQQEYVVRYGSPDESPVDPAEFAPPLGRFYVGYVDGVAVVTGGWRDVHALDLGGAVGVVAPAARGRGLARAMLAWLERTAADAGLTTMILETGLKQPEAVELYRTSGYTDVAAFGHYAEHELSVHLGKTLGGEISGKQATGKQATDEQTTDEQTTDKEMTCPSTPSAS